MSFPAAESMQIVTYRDFYDVPRYILSRDASGVFWVFDCRFNDELDDYESMYVVYCVGSGELEAQTSFVNWASGSADLKPVGKVVVATVRFDESRRKSILPGELLAP